jgi:hypothetical protein
MHVVISMSAKKMKRDYCLHSSSAIVSRCVRLQMAVLNLARKLVTGMTTAINEEFPSLELSTSLS